MTAPEFRPGDRVRVRDFSTDPWVIGLVCEGPPVRPFVNTQPYGTHRFQETELVLRPVYPEPGQVAVLLDADELQALFIVTSNAVAGADSGYDIGDYFDAYELLLKVYERAKADKRAREASRG